MNYSASYDTTTKIITPIALIAMVAGIVVIWIIDIEEMHFYKYLSLAVLCLVLIISWGYAPKSYSIDDGFVHVNRMLMHPAKIKIDEIMSVEAVSKAQLKGSIRLFGSGAFFGYYGTFISKKLGRMKWFATNPANAVFIKTQDGRKYLLTPDERDSFIRTLQNSIKKAA